ncbi:MAG: DUF4304 domain-containing protein [Caulobacter sp.]|nr:DUF4304 domain-containing protein [Caulobacter sp.]
MAAENIEQAFKVVLGQIADHLKPHGFSKRGNAFRRLSSGNAIVVEVQRSQSSTNDFVRFTFNVGVVSGRLLEERQPDVSKVGAMDAHLRERIGQFLANPADKWWELDAGTKPIDLVTDLAPLLDAAVRFLQAHADDAQLIELWESGQSPGLTDFQRQRFLRELKAA